MRDVATILHEMCRPPNKPNTVLLDDLGFYGKVVWEIFNKDFDTWQRHSFNNSTGRYKATWDDVALVLNEVLQESPSE